MKTTVQHLVIGDANRYDRGDDATRREVIAAADDAVRALLAQWAPGKRAKVHVKVELESCAG